MGLKTPLLLLLVIALFNQSLLAQSDRLLLRSDAPSRYTVVEGDTLWDIAGTFLNDPWRWQEIWQTNSFINNPDLIYPGDLLVLSEQDGRPVLKALRKETVKLEPQIYSEGRANAIPTIEPSVIQAFVRSPLITDKNELITAGYVAGGLNESLLMGKYDQVYARGIEGEPGDQFRAFRPGKVYQDLTTGEVLGQEARHIADLRLLRQGAESSKMTVLSAHEELVLGDRLQPVEVELGRQFFYPVAAPDHLRGHVLDVPLGVGETGPMATVVLNFGYSQAVIEGSVFRVYRAGVINEDPVTGENFELPEEPVGLALVYRSFERVSFALITNASQPIRIGDAIISPDLAGMREQESRLEYYSEIVVPATENIGGANIKDCDQRKETSLWRRILNKECRN